ncbi:glycosyltransferase [Roseiflexus castenholzii]|uniref:Glycosyl transferase group 1 n=1 Tax=Roseiflexus castenholzii (strain DSM 13941 / HLO8) TaxID=383372 RepID=A7NQ50_ROSCS|nr:glycosyltransferase [Roseiflexus castenholzii]ABU59696.1 glycosyl transferase group 1 [Roseiflexus castenholzii DSM 13941]
MKNLVRRALRRFGSYSEGYGAGWSLGGQPRILFVSGMDGAPLRYRVLHQAEQIALAGGSWMLVRDTESRLRECVQQCDILYLYKAGTTLQACEAVQTARRNALPVVYDTDDLNWDERLVEYCDLERYYSPPDVVRFRRIFREAEQLMQSVDCFITSTDYLAAALTAHFGIPAYVNANALSQQAIMRAEPFYRRRAAAPPRAPVTLGYFSGWPKAHESDLAVALPAVRRALDALPGARLRIVGHFERSALPVDLREWVEIAPFVPYERLFAEIARVDINLAPLVDNPHRRAKSAVKFLEAALVGVPTVASNLEPYRLIDHGRTGMLAANEEEWYAAIMALATDPLRRRAIGDAARRYVLEHETTSVRAPGFANLLRHLIDTLPLR